MAKKKILHRRLAELTTNLPAIDITKKDKLSWAVIQLGIGLKQPIKTQNKLRENIFADTASVDSDGNFFMLEGKPDLQRVSKENKKRRDERLEKLLDTDIEIEHVLITDLTRVKTLPPFLIEIFNGILFNIDKSEIEAIYNVEQNENNDDQKDK